MHKTAIAITSGIVSFVVLLLVIFVIAIFAAKSSLQSRNVCNGKVHRIGDVEIQFTKCKIDGDAFEIEVATKNVSEGAVFQPTQRFDVFDNFNNPVYVNKPPNEYISAGESEVAKYAGDLPSKNATSIFIKMRVCTGRDSQGEFIQTVNGSFSR